MFYFRTIYLKTNKEFRSSIKFIYGIGKHKSLFVASRLGFAFPLIFTKLNRFYLNIVTFFLTKLVSEKVKLERKMKYNIYRLVEMGSYRGKRQKDHLPCRGQRTRTNASTRKHRGFNNFQ